MSRAFQPLAAYPELTDVQAQWRTIRAEAMAAAGAMIGIDDERSTPGRWKALPLMPEEEDRAFVPEAIRQRSRTLAPRTIGIVEKIPHLKGYAFSLLCAGSRIRPHRHHNPYVTASLCLKSGADSYILVDGERREYCDGEIIVFDYRLTHEVVNNGDEDRIALLVLLDIRHGDG